MLNKIILFVGISLVLSLIIIYILYYPPTGAQKISLNKVETIEHSELPADAIRIAIGGIVSPRQTVAYYKELLNCISRKINKPIMPVQRDNYTEINALLKSGQVDGAFVCSGPYISAHDDYGAEILAVPVIKESFQYTSYIIVHKNSAIRTIDDLKYKSFGLGQVLSSAGWIYPAYLIAQRNSRMDIFFSRTVTIPGHDNIIKAVAEQWVDGGAVNSLVWDYLNETDPVSTAQTRIIHKSVLWGNPPFIIRKGFPEESKIKLRDVFLSLHTDSEGAAILKKMLIDRFIEGKDEWYEPIRQMLKEMKQ